MKFLRLEEFIYFVWRADVIIEAGFFLPEERPIAYFQHSLDAKSRHYESTCLFGNDSRRGVTSISSYSNSLGI